MEAAKAEVLRYLGHRNQEIGDKMEELVVECMNLIRAVATPRQIQKNFEVVIDKAGVSLASAKILLEGKEILRHMRGCTRAVLFAATLGSEADRMIRYWESADLTKSVVLDACATQRIEEICDEIEEGVRRKAESCGMGCVSRFSPGYGDLPLEIQPKLLAALDATRKIGLTCTDTLIMVPRKSVTAIIGLGEDVRDDGVNCGDCEDCLKKDSCHLRKEGVHA